MSYDLTLALRNKEVLDFLKVREDTPTKDVIDLMVKLGKDFALVEKENKPAGIFSESDVVKLKYENKDMSAPVYDYASKPVLSVAKNHSLFEAINLMIENNISKLVIVDEKDQAIGVLTQRTLINVIDQEMLKKNKFVGDVIKAKKIIGLSKEDKLHDALKMLVENGIRALVVLEDAKPVGIITQKDIMNLIAQNIDLENSLVKDYMKSPVMTCGLDTPLIEASKKMAQFNIRRLVVVDEKGDAFSIITQGDIIRNIEGSYEDYIEKKLKGLRQMLNIMQDPVLEIIDIGIFNEPSIVWENESAKKVFGNLIGKNITSFIDKYTWENIYEKLVKEKSANYEPLFVGNNIYNISLVYMEDEFKIINGRIKIIFKDITANYKSELALKKINRQYQNILDSMSDMVIIYDADTYAIKFANKSALESLGYSEYELVGKNFFDIIMNADRVIKHFIERIVKEGKKVIGRRVYIKKSGELLPVHVVATKVSFEDNLNRDNILVVARDISKELIIEEKLKNTNKDLNLLYSFITDLSKAHEEDEAYEILLHYLKKIGIDYIHMYKLNPSLNKVITSYLLKAKNFYEYHNAENIWLEDCLEDSPAMCKVVKSGTSLTVLDKKSDYGCPKAKIGDDVKSYMCVPVFLGGTYVTNASAILTLMSLKPNFFTDELKHKIHKFIEAFTPVLSNIRLIKINQELSIRDPLTNAYNRRFLDEVLDREFKKAQRRQTKLSIIMIDLDNFKKFNDTYGHRAGDIALQTIANTVRENIRMSDIFARYGGEEFMIVLPETSKEAAVDVANRIRKSISSKIIYVPISDEEILHTSISASFGLSTFDDDAKDLEKLIKIADERLYTAKKLGKNQVVYEDRPTPTPAG